MRDEYSECEKKSFFLISTMNDEKITKCREERRGEELKNCSDNE